VCKYDGVADESPGNGTIARVATSSATLVLVALGKIAVLPALAVGLSSSGFAVYALVTALLGFAGVTFGLNVNAYTLRAIPGLAHADARRLVATTALVEASLAATVLAILAVSGAGRWFLEALNVSEYSFAFSVAAVWLVVELVNLNLRGYLFGMHKVGRANILELLRQIGWLPLLLVYWVIVGALSVDILMLALAAGSLLAAAYGAWAVRLTLRWPIDLALARRAVLFGAALIIPALSLPAMRLADRSVLSASRSFDEVAAYAFAVGLITGVYSFTAFAIETITLPRAARRMNGGDAAGAMKVLLTGMTYSAWAFGVGTLLLWLAAPLLARVLSGTYATGLGLIPLLAAGYLGLVLSRAPHNALYLQDRTKTILVVDIVATATAIILDVGLIPSLGITGAALASAAGFALGATGKFATSGLYRGLGWRALIPTSVPPPTDDDAV